MSTQTEQALAEHGVNNPQQLTAEQIRKLTIEQTRIIFNDLLAESARLGVIIDDKLGEIERSAAALEQRAMITQAVRRAYPARPRWGWW